MKLPILVINFKTYSEASGNNGLNLARSTERIAKEFGVNFVVVPQLIDMVSIAQEVDIPVFSQHFDIFNPGSATGHIDFTAIKEAGITGSLLNHSERRLEISQLAESVDLANKNNLKTIVCSGTTNISKAVSAFGPWAVAMEPPELIGGDVSVTTRPDAVTETIKVVREIDPEIVPLTGAGVKTSEHLKVAIELGSQGVLLASGIVKAQDPAKVLQEMATVMAKY